MMIATAPIVEEMEPIALAEEVRPDEESRRWLDELRAEGATKDAAVARLHAVLLRAARFEVGCCLTYGGTSSTTSRSRLPTMR